MSKNNAKDKKKFWLQEKCRCGEELRMRFVSWFTKEPLCVNCADYESKLKRIMQNSGINPDDYKNCGYLPKVIGRDVKKNEKPEKEK